MVKLNARYLALFILTPSKQTFFTVFVMETAQDGTVYEDLPILPSDAAVVKRVPARERYNHRAYDFLQFRGFEFLETVINRVMAW
jgi:hypothetical protein